MMWDEVGLTLDMAGENDRHNSGFVVAPAGYRAQMNAPKSSSRFTLIAPIDDMGAPFPPIAIVQSDDNSSIFAPSHVQLGTNYFSTDPLKRFPGMPKVTRNGIERQGFVYQSPTGGITPAILTHAIKNVWGPCYPTRSAEEFVGSLCDAYGYHWEKEVLDAMQEEFFVGIMGVPNATGLWQVADIRNNGILKIKWVQAKRILLAKKRADLFLPEAERRVPKGEHDKLVRTDVVILLNMVFAPSHCDEELNRRTIALSGVVPFTKCLLGHPEVTQGSGDRAARLAAATDAAAAAAGDVNVGVLGREGLRALAQEKREKERAIRGGMQLDDDGVVLDDLGDEQAALIRAMGGVKAKGGSMFAASQQMNDPDGLIFTGTAVRAVAARVAASNVAKEQKQVADAELRRLAESTAAGRGAAAGRGGRQGRGRVSWKAAAAELGAQSKDETAALKSRIRELEAALAAGRGGGGARAAVAAGD